METENKILVVYLGIAGIRSEDIEDYVHKVTARITPQTFEGEIIIIPAQSYETRVECVNPKYVTEPELIQKHTELMKELHDELAHQIEEIRIKNEEKN